MELERQLSNFRLADTRREVTGVNEVPYVIDHFVPFPQSEYGGGMSLPKMMRNVLML